MGGFYFIFQCEFDNRSFLFQFAFDINWRSKLFMLVCMKKVVHSVAGRLVLYVQGNQQLLHPEIALDRIERRACCLWLSNAGHLSIRLLQLFL